jgi:hypothetical protein
VDQSHGGRVAYEGDASDIGEAMAEQALPGVFASGKRVIESNSGNGPGEGQKFLHLGFDDGSSMVIVGQFAIHASQPGVLACKPDDVDESAGLNSLRELLP